MGLYSSKFIQQELYRNIGLYSNRVMQLSENADITLHQIVYQGYDLCYVQIKDEHGI